MTQSIRFGDNIKDYRLKTNQSMQSLGNQLHCSPTAIWHWEHNDRLPSVEQLSRIAEILMVTVDDLLFADHLPVPTANGEDNRCVSIAKTKSNDDFEGDSSN